MRTLHESRVCILVRPQLNTTSMYSRGMASQLGQRDTTLRFLILIIRIFVILVFQRLTVAGDAQLYPLPRGSMCTLLCESTLRCTLILYYIRNGWKDIYILLYYYFLSALGRHRSCALPTGRPLSCPNVSIRRWVLGDCHFNKVQTMPRSLHPSTGSWCVGFDVHGCILFGSRRW